MNLVAWQGKALAALVPVLALDVFALFLVKYLIAPIKESFSKNKRLSIAPRKHVELSPAKVEDNASFQKCIFAPKDILFSIRNATPLSSNGTEGQSTVLQDLP